ncbi:MAG: response regulator [Alphaproteobacteria bacterium]|nr:response regulator [Alphaproteobacteria bacterium]
MLDRVLAAPPVDVKPAAIKQAHSVVGASPKPTVLVVDDEHSTLIYMEHVLQLEGYRVLIAESGEDALKALEASGSLISVVVMDLNMPGIDGLEVVELMKKNKNTEFIPVIMATASQGTEIVREGVNAGVYYCVHKPVDVELLCSLIDAATREFDQTKLQQQALDSQRMAMEILQNARFTCKTLSEVEVLARLLSTAYPEPQRSIIGINELLINAVEHGNLGVSYHEKTELVTAGVWRQTVDARQKLPAFAGKKVEVIIQRKADGIYLQISDEGEGFEWWRYLEIDPARATHPNGRGIALANKISFDSLKFTHNGSRVLAVLHTNAQSTTTGKKATTLNW